MLVLINSYPLGQSVHLSAVFTMPGCSPTFIDPDTVTLRVKPPALATQVYEYPADIIKDDDGHYHLDVDASTSGTWFYRWEGTGLYQAVAERSFTVRDTQFGTSP